MPKKSIPSPSKGPSKRRIILFKGISIVLIPLLILFLAEMLLRAFSYGDNLSLFVDYKADKNYLVLNPDASKKYFTEQQIATKGNSEIFKKKKGDSTIRIFVLGESTTIGYPYFHNGSFHRWLQYRLAHTYPDKNFEIINLSLTAVNSYTVLGFAKELVNYQPDAVLIYTGHNEYYGALGAASTQSLGSNPHVINFILNLRDLRLAQLIINIYDGLRKNAEPAASKSGEGRMELMVAKEEIPLHSDLYQKGVEQFTYNMNAVMELFSKRHIPLFVSNLVSNEKDLKPFISFGPAKKSPEFENALLMGEKAFTNRDFNSAENWFNKAGKLYPASALCNYYLGHLAYQKGDFEQAKQYFIKAKDLDGLRFRAPEQFNQILSELCNKYPGTHLVDTKAAFENSAEHHIIGQDLTVDHVHPDLRGYAIMSDAFYKAITKYKIVAEESEYAMSFKQLLQNMPVSTVDSIGGVYRVLNLKKRWPYNDPHATDSIKVQSTDETLAYKLVFENVKWDDIMNNQFNYYLNNHEPLKARNILENIVLEYPADTGLYERMGMLSGELQDTKNIIYNFKRSFNLAPTFNKARYLFVNYLKNDEPAKAIRYIDYAINNNTAGLNLAPVRNTAGRLVQLQQQYQRDTTNVPVLLQIANAHAVMGNKDGAVKYAAKVLKIDPQNKIAQAFIKLQNSNPAK
jgi:tetratricopeptide (TPR) repeat protein